MEPIEDLTDPAIKDLKQQVEQLKAMTQETNRLVHGMRRSQRWHAWLRVLWWVVIFGFSALSYYYFVQPYVDQALSAYGNAKDFQLQVQNFFAQFGHAAPTNN